MPQRVQRTEVLWKKEPLGFDLRRFGKVVWEDDVLSGVRCDWAKAIYSTDDRTMRLYLGVGQIDGDNDAAIIAAMLESFLSETGITLLKEEADWAGRTVYYVLSRSRKCEGKAGFQAVQMFAEVLATLGATGVEERLLQCPPEVKPTTSYVIRSQKITWTHGEYLVNTCFKEKTR